MTFIRWVRTSIQYNKAPSIKAQTACEEEFRHSYVFFVLLTFYLRLHSTQKSYTKKGKAAAKAAATAKIQNGKANGHITHDINHNVTDTKPSENKKEN